MEVFPYVLIGNSSKISSIDGGISKPRCHVSFRWINSRSKKRRSIISPPVNLPYMAGSHQWWWLSTRRISNRKAWTHTCHPPGRICRHTPTWTLRKIGKIKHTNSDESSSENNITCLSIMYYTLYDCTQIVLFGAGFNVPPVKQCFRRTKRTSKIWRKGTVEHTVGVLNPM